ncbi:hypothetical protein HanPI659440_Chr01g0012591 [Helianthus annuus]|nr:hypothetical protein HanPI659440_Chr01g0012591 [Helianthus annuus]
MPMFMAVSVRGYALSLIESYGYLLFWTVFALSKPPFPRMQSTTTSSEPLYKHTNCEIGQYPTSFSTFGCTLGTGTEGRSMELDRRWLLHMRVSTNASVLYQFSQAGSLFLTF